MNNVCVIGGSRYFGRHLLELLRDSGSRVTVVNRGSVPPPPGVEHLVADRDDEAALTAAVGGREFDVVIDQVCYTPRQAAIADRAFTAARYVMTSTIEVYNPATSPLIVPTGEPVPESALDPASWQVGAPMPEGGRSRYAEGKRQAEAVLARSGRTFATVRVAHVLGGADFTGRLKHYVERIAAGQPVAVHDDPMPTSFIGHREIAGFLRWTAESDVTGPVNACSHGRPTAADLCEMIGAQLGRAPVYRRPGDASPFSFDNYYAMDNSRATGLGFAFEEVSDWLPDAVAEAA